jgi:hypothetical protein
MAIGVVDMSDNTKKSKSGNWFVRHKVMTVVLAIIVIAIIGGAAGGGDESASTANSADATGGTQSDKAAETKPSATTAKLNEAARDGKFEFTVTAIKCGETTVGNEYLKENAQGQFCRASLSIKNIGDEAQSIDSNSQYLYNAAGQKYTSSSTATIYAAPSASTSTW